jgi:hypothetical protein
MKYLIVLAGPLLAYLLCGFIAWDLNPGNWTDDGRFVCALLGLMAAGVLWMNASEQKENA